MRWSDEIDVRFGVADTTDVFSGGVRCRGYSSMASSLQVDVSFWPHDLFRATEPAFASPQLIREIARYHPQRAAGLEQPFAILAQPVPAPTIG